ncbi:MAG: hypothetical protein ABJF11_10100 [Reichenbachiella sp.]|uniref:VOC family protein n=1 Tax=Reichenbachiella sp. TaxID=2184521 RepID=UPI003263C74A
MKIEILTLASANLALQQSFYESLIGFQVRHSNSEELMIEAGETKLVFRATKYKPLYHFAFLIPTGSLESAIDLIESKGIKLLPLKGEKIIHFDSGRAIYFYDPEGNIAEFIERPKIDYPKKKSFAVSDVIRINEIGHPVINPLEESAKLLAEDGPGIIPINPSAFRSNFCWIGDHEGAIIVVETGRHWLPTQLPAEFNDFDLTYNESGHSKTLSFKAGSFKEI